MSKKVGNKMYINIEKVAKLVNDKKCDAIILFNESNMHYICSFSPSEGVIIVTKGASAYHIVDSRYTEIAQINAQKTGVKVIEVKTSFSDTAKEIIEKENIKKLLYENETISLLQYKTYTQKFSGCEFVELNHELMLLRNKKEPFEIELMKEANNIAEKSLLELLNEVKAGKTEKELASLFDYIMAKNGSEKVSFDTILLTGTHTSMPHGTPSDRKVQAGDFVLFDFGATYMGYHSDMTRTIAIDHATDEMEEAYELVLKAQLEGIKALSAGQKCADVYQKAYDVLDKKDMAKYFRHSLGHGVGLEIHEAPIVGIKNDTCLKENMIITDEPGIYIAGNFGVRIEDTVLVTKKGAIALTESDKECIIIEAL